MIRTKQLARMTLALLFLVGSSSAQGPRCGVHCGTERWAVKTFSDTTASTVSATPTQETVHNLRAIHRPSGPLPALTRSSPVEITTYKVKAKLVGYKAESDRDFHVVIADLDNTNETMIIEIPNPACAGACASNHAAEYRTARGNVIRLLGPVPAGAHGLRRPKRPITIEVIGVGFFDFNHGQTGRAPNNLEIHPVLSLTQVQ
jgi:hypothetical protein